MVHLYFPALFPIFSIPPIFTSSHFHSSTSSHLIFSFSSCNSHDLTWNPTGILKALAPLTSPMESDVGAAIESLAIPATRGGSDATEPFPVRDVYEVTSTANSPVSVANEGALRAPS